MSAAADARPIADEPLFEVEDGRRVELPPTGAPEVLLDGKDVLPGFRLPLAELFDEAQAGGR